MRFERLHLEAFGPFTDELLDLSGGSPGGLHVIYGSNEAGKTTSLRAVKNLLFGMPNSSPDAHVHPSNQLAISAALSQGDEQHFVRRLKRRKDDLVGHDGLPLAQNPLPRLLGNLDERTFSLRFGLNQEELAKGAEALLGGSEQGLFSAGTAGASVRDVLGVLSHEANELFLFRGKKPLLNRQLAEYEKATRQATVSVRAPEKWLEQQRAHHEAVAGVEELRNRRAAALHQLRHHNQLKAVVADLGDHQRLTSRKEQLHKVVVLSETAPQQRQDARLSLSQAEAEAGRIESELALFQKELKELPEASGLAHVETERLELSSRVGTAVSARRDLPKRAADLAAFEREIAGALRDLGLQVQGSNVFEQARARLVSDQAARAVRDLLAQKGQLVAGVSEAERSLAAIASKQRRLREREADVSAHGSLERLQALCGQAQGMLEERRQLRRVAEKRQNLLAQIAELRAHCGTALAASELAAVLVHPSAVSKWLEQYSELRREALALSSRRQQLQARMQQAKSVLAEIEAGDLPSQGQLESHRRGRDTCLQEMVAAADLARAPELRELMQKTDGAADRMIAGADRIAERRRLSLELEQLELTGGEVSELSSLSARKIEEAADQLERWASSWGLLHAPSAEALPQLASQLAELLAAENQAEQLAFEISQGRATLAEFCGNFAHFLGSEADSLGLEGLLSMANARLEQGLRQRERLAVWKEQRSELDEQHELAQQRLDESRARWAGWQREWAQAVAPLGMKGTATVEQAQDALATLEGMRRSLSSADELQRRIEGMRRDTEALHQDVLPLVQAHCAQITNEDPVDMAARLLDEITVAVRARDERKRIETAISERSQALADAQARIQQAAQRLADLRMTAGVSTDAELLAAESASEEKREVLTRHAMLTARIVETAGGATVEELLEQARPFIGSVGRLSAKIDELDVLSTDLEEQLRAAERDAEATRLGLETYRTEDVAHARQLATSHESAAKASLRQFLVLRAAHILLQQRISDYAERFAGPIVGRAGELFSRVTLGKYSSLSVGTGEQVLRCMARGQQKEVEALSSGARAQLYFALRVASLEVYFQQHAPVPLVFDDLFLEFDDDRASAGFEVLAELSQQVQVLFFTHLARDVEKAHDAVPPSRLFCHTIGLG